MNGGVVVIIPREIVLSAEDFAVALRRQPVKAMFLTSALFNQMAQSMPGAFHSVDTLMVGGDAVNPVWARRVLSSEGSPRRLLNGYGPTESTTFARTYEIDNLPENAGTVPIGRPIANTQVFVLDRCLRPLPPGVPGELFIAGDGLATGYVNNAARTSWSFIHSPFGAPGSRMYRTGDMARLRFDGCIDFLGRNDDQVKVRGFRIELGEIEAALVAHPEIDAAAALVRVDNAGNKRLLAYYVTSARAEVRPAPTEIKAFLAARLPEYMLPGSLIRLDALPLNRNGKVDRAKLSYAASEETHESETRTAPRNPTEEQLLGIWRQVLGIEEIGVEDNFFELGGDSILSMRVVTEARKLGIALTAKRFLECQTVAGLAAAAGASELREDLNSSPLNGPLELSPSQAWHFERHAPDFGHYNMAIRLEVPKVLDDAALETAVQALFIHHDAMRLQFRCDGEGWKQSTAESAPGACLAVIDLSHLSSEFAREDAIRTRTAEIQGSLDHFVGPLIRFAYFRPPQGAPGTLLVVTNHLVADAVSLRILLEDLATAYLQAEAGQPIELPPKTTSYTRWTDHVKRRVKEGALDHEFRYWIDELSGADVSVRCDHTPELERDDVEMWSRTIVERVSEEDTRFLLQEAPAKFKSKFNELLLVAFARAFSRWNIDKKVFVDLSVHGREAFDDAGHDISRTVGWFSGLAPLLLEPCGGAEFADDLALVKRKLARMPRGGTGYQMLRYSSSDSEERKALLKIPSPEVCFAYLGQFDDRALGNSPFTMARTAGGPARSPRARRRYLLELFIGVVDRQLEIECNFSPIRYEERTVRALLEELAWTLRSFKEEGAF